MFRRPIISTALVILLTITAGLLNAAEPYAVGHKVAQLADPNGLRPVNLHLLYPTTSSQTAVKFGDNAALYGFDAIPDASIADGRFPLVMVSHGLFGRWSNEGWLAAELAKGGMIIAAPDHPGTAWSNKDSLETPKLWERPRDLSRIIDFLTSDEPWLGSIDTDHIGAIGHSLGGYTVMALAGARYDLARHRDYCAVYPSRADCRFVRKVGIGSDPADWPSLEKQYQDPRLTAAISLDLGLAQAFDPISVAAIDIPVLVIGAGQPLPDLPVAAESRHLAGLLPEATSTYREIEDVSHFSFFAECKPGAIDLLAGAGEGDEIICQDSGGRDRKALHAEIEGLITMFLKEAGFVKESRR